MTRQLYYNEIHSSVVIRCTEPFRAKQLTELADACRCSIVEDEHHADYLLADLSSISVSSTEHYSEIVGYLSRCGAKALIWIAIDQLDSAFAVLPVERCHFLVDAQDELAVPILSRSDRRANMDQLHDRSRESEYGALHKISDELADFARTLARIAEQESNVDSKLRDKPVSFRQMPSSAFEPLVPSPADENEATATTIRDLIKLRRLRDQHFPTELFADPGWDILLDLFAAKLEGKSVSVSSLCIAAAVPPTTALRWITMMTDHGALIRRQDPDDARRVFIDLSADSDLRIRDFFANAVARGLLPI